MEPFISHTGVGVPLRRSNVDTDQIIPAVYLKRVTRTGFEDGLFAAWRGDPEFVLNNEAFAGGSVLVAGPDFGTGSSREHAVWALKDYGFRAVLSSRFADIFRGNAGKQGLVAAQLSQADIELIWKVLENHPGTEVTVDLKAEQVRCADIVAPLSIDAYTRWRLMEGLDDIGLTLRHADAIASFEGHASGLEAHDHTDLRDLPHGRHGRSEHHFEKIFPHRPRLFPGVAGEAADLMGEVAARLALLPGATASCDDEITLLHKRFHVALALSRHDPHAAGAALRTLLERLSARS